jgi:hypothetical protein
VTQRLPYKPEEATHKDPAVSLTEQTTIPLRNSLTEVGFAVASPNAGTGMQCSAASNGRGDPIPV